MSADGFSKTDAELIARIDRRELDVLIHSNMEIPDELRGECPRAVPDWISSFKGIRRPWIASWCCVLTFVAAIALGAWPVGDPLGQIAFGLTLILGLVGVVGCSLFAVISDMFRMASLDRDAFFRWNLYRQLVIRVRFYRSNMSSNWR